jgi:superfamily II DNA helicase RecQ
MSMSLENNEMVDIPPTLHQYLKNFQPRTDLWMREIITHGLGYEPHDWQAQLANSLYCDHDLLLTVKTGAGKSTLLHAVVLAARAEGRTPLVFTIVPTLALMDDQVRLTAVWTPVT